MSAAMKLRALRDSRLVRILVGGSAVVGVGAAGGHALAPGSSHTPDKVGPHDRAQRLDIEGTATTVSVPATTVGLAPDQLDAADAGHSAPANTTAAGANTSDASHAGVATTGVSASQSAEASASPEVHDNRGPGGLNSGPGSVNSGPGSINSGPGNAGDGHHDAPGNVGGTSGTSGSGSGGSSGGTSGSSGGSNSGSGGCGGGH